MVKLLGCLEDMVSCCQLWDDNGMVLEFERVTSAFTSCGWYISTHRSVVLETWTHVPCFLGIESKCLSAIGFLVHHHLGSWRRDGGGIEMVLSFHGCPG